MKKIRLSPRFVIYQEGDLWFAHSLEFDIVAEGRTPIEALTDALQLCVTQLEFALEQGDITSVFRPAPPEFWAMHSKAADLPFPQFEESWPKSIEVDQVDARELVLCD